MIFFMKARRGKLQHRLLAALIGERIICRAYRATTSSLVAKEVCPK
jgi:hypothetical protein